MPSYNELHRELRLRVPNKPYELYDDVIRWAVDHICRKTSLWKITTNIVTKPSKSLYDLDLPLDTAIHSNLYIVRKANTDIVIKRPVNGFLVHPTSELSDYLQAFKTIGSDQIQIFPTPKNGGITLEVHTAVKPTRLATGSDNDKFFDEYKDTVIYGALSRLFEIDRDAEQLMYNKQEFKNGVSSIHVDVLNENADTPMKMSAGW